MESLVKGPPQRECVRACGSVMNSAGGEAGHNRCPLRQRSDSNRQKGRDRHVEWCKERRGNAMCQAFLAPKESLSKQFVPPPNKNKRLIIHVRNSREFDGKAARWELVKA